MRTISEQSRRNAGLAMYTGSTTDPHAAAAIFAETGVDLSKKKAADPVADGKALMGFLILVAAGLLAAPLYVAARGLWMAEPALKPHDVDTGLLMGFAVFALAALGLFLTAARRIHPLPVFVVAGTVLSLGLLVSENPWAMEAFLLLELAFLAAWARHRRGMAKRNEKIWKRVRDWSVLLVCALVLLTFTQSPATEDLADAGAQLAALLTTGMMTRAGEIGAPYGLPGFAVAAGLPVALALLYVPLAWTISKVMRWRGSVHAAEPLTSPYR